MLITLNQTQFLLCSFVCAVLHEAAHISAYMSYGASIISVEIQPFGFSATVGKGNALPCSAEVFCAASGPLMNLFLSAIFIYIPETHIKGTEYFIYCNLAFFVLNLIPAVPLDGGRILYFLLLKCLPVSKALTYVKYVSLFLTIVILTFGFLLLYNTKSNVSILLIGIYLLFYIFTSFDSF